MRGKLTMIVIISSLALTSVALASSPPVKGGRYKGTDTAKTYNSVTLKVTKSRANFASGRINLILNGQGGLGSCAGRSYLTLSPTKARQITKAGTFDLHGTFTYGVPTPYGPQTYTAKATIKGAFSHHGKKVSGTVQETSSNKSLTCKSGLLSFKASLVK